MAGSTQAQTVNMTVPDVIITSGETAELTCSLENSMEIAGWQMYLYLPEGIDIAYEEEDGERYYDETVVLSSRHKRSHTCSISPTADGGYLIQAYNPSKPTAINGNSGEIVSITLQADSGYSGANTATIKNVAVSDMGAVQTNMVGDVTVNIIGPTPTDISPVMTTADDELRYDLNGRRMSKSQKGITVSKGRKVVVK